jgi:hypothetical protein
MTTQSTLDGFFLKQLVAIPTLVEQQTTDAARHEARTLASNTNLRTTLAISACSTTALVAQQVLGSIPHRSWQPLLWHSYLHRMAVIASGHNRLPAADSDDVLLAHTRQRQAVEMSAFASAPINNVIVRDDASVSSCAFDNIGSLLVSSCRKGVVALHRFDDIQATHLVQLNETRRQARQIDLQSQYTSSSSNNNNNNNTTSASGVPQQTTTFDAAPMVIVIDDNTEDPILDDQQQANANPTATATAVQSSPATALASPLLVLQTYVTAATQRQHYCCQASVFYCTQCLACCACANDQTKEHRAGSMECTQSRRNCMCIHDLSASVHVCWW